MLTDPDPRREVVATAPGGVVRAGPRDGGGLVVTVILPTAAPSSEYPT
ncbi:hypothetical protein Drose_31960 [Dactylosporangium roseum]|uniref:Uncharacterized protein n=1 Tax=Dactylosporangium roseum TaxID=47989 RepID=A0ABY5Z0X3_9ACTN|nr:hypothetical protein [Dactylosporangium roseum]UWZ35676.1 hypothetical protein Drose_31960 [Dactylosporangium roseum]